MTSTVYLPRSQTAEASPETAEPVARQQSGTRLLVVDDEPALVRLTQALLSQLGYTVIAATSAEEALSRFQTTPDDFDLLLTDQIMPGLTGIALIRECRRLRPDLPVILCSGFSPSINEASAMAKGVNAFLSKPIALSNLSHTIHQVLNPEFPK